MTTDASAFSEQYRAAIRWERKRMGDRWLERNVGRVPDGEVSAFHARMGAGFRRIGIYALLLDDRTDAADRFEKSAAHYATSVQERRRLRAAAAETEEPELLLEAVYASILSRNWELMGVVAREARTAEGSPGHSPTLRSGYHRLAFLSSLLTGHDTDAPLADLSTAVGDLSPDVRPSFEPYVTTFEGLAAAEPAAVSTGIRELLDLHDGGLTGKPTRARELVCYPATALSRLAQDRGLGLRIDSRYVPTAAVE